MDCNPISTFSVTGEAEHQLYCLDFDGTITCRDTFVAFIRYVFGTVRCLVGFLAFSPILVLMKLHLYPNWKAKQRVFAHFFRGMDEAEFACLGAAFARDRQQLARPRAIETMRQAAARGYRLCVVSASVEQWVQPFVMHFLAGTDGSRPDIHFLCTQAECAGGKMTGRFLTPNCYGAEKVRRLQALLAGDRRHYVITAFGDSRGDRELLAYADKGYYKPFR